MNEESGPMAPFLRAHARVSKAYSKLRGAARRAVGYPVVHNVNKAKRADREKRALLVYLVRPFQLPDGDERFRTHQNLSQCKQIAAVLGEFGYRVDAADVGDRKFRPSGPYDLVISHRVDLDTASVPDAVCVYLATGMSHIAHNRSVRKRYEELYQRRHCRLKEHRLHSEVMPFLDRAVAIAGFGNEHTAGTWSGIFQGPIYMFNNYGFPETRFVEGRRATAARGNFLFFASQDQVGKGLDLLLEVFPRHPEWNLYVCSDFEDEAEFCRCYRKELFETPQVHPVGRIRVGSDEFHDLAERCAFVILPSCSEGSAGSVVQCMFTGLIPVVSKEAGIDAGRFGVTLASNSVAEVEKTLLELTEQSAEWLRDRSLTTRQISEAEYSETAFVGRWRAILTDILGMGRLSL
jgi:hypothetical protein